MPRSAELFSTVTTQGALLPPDLLARVAAGDPQLKGLRPEDYDLAPGERLGEMANRSWTRLVGAWAALRGARQGGDGADALTGVTRERWLRVLFQELQFGPIPSTPTIELDGRGYPLSHLWRGPAPVPVHMVGVGVDLDSRRAGVAGAARMSPHSLMQELLNQWDDALWGVVTNGLRLRVLRDNASLTRQAFVEFDLEAMMEGEVYSDFVMLWLLCHESRFRAESAADCWLERWTREAAAQGTRALEHLREGVERAIASLGEGFLAHPANERVRETLRTGELTTQDYYRLLLRLVYRLLFLLVAESRDLLLPADVDAPARDRYRRFYSIERLRRLAEVRKGGEHSDLYESLKVVMGALDDAGIPALGLPPLGSLLWSPSAIGWLDGARIANRALLGAVRALVFVESDRAGRAVDYRNLGPEELGSVYESLLELHPEVHVDAARFRLVTASGHERKTTGSYYTPTELIVSLLDTALDPVLERAARADDPERAILALKVVDPACGSGHFLLAASQRIARRLAAVRTGDDEPAPSSVRLAVRDVIAHCVYGVDVNPMAVELCKVALWMESLVPGRPLSFLDHRVRCGQSLLGATPRLLSEGIPDEAFKPIEGDDRQVASSWRKRNRQERAGQMTLGLGEDGAALQATLVAGMSEVVGAGDGSVDAVREQERRFRALDESEEMRRARLAADAWCAAFVARKARDEPVVTEEARRRLEADPSSVSAAVRERVACLAARYRFFHWHLAFPDVFGVPVPGERAENGTTGWNGGFDVVLGNPPWEMMQLQELEFFAARAPDIASTTGARRKRLIADLAESDPGLDAAYRSALREVEAATHFLRDSGRYPLCGLRRINTYSVFAETMRSLIGPRGRAGIIVPTGIATDDTTKAFFSSLVEGQNLGSLYDFENRAGLFPEVDSRVKFCLLTMTGSRRPIEGAEFVFFAHRTQDLADEQRRFRLTAADFRLFNPNTRTCPIFRTRRDAEITRRIYQRIPVLIDRTRPDGNPWGISFKQGLFNMTSDSALFRTRAELEDAGWTLEGNVFRRGTDCYLPLYEGKMFHHFDHRFASYQDGEWRELTPCEKCDPGRLALPRYWVPSQEVHAKAGGRGCIPLWRRIARTTDERTCIVGVLAVVGVGDSGFIACLETSTPPAVVNWAAHAASAACDFVARQKVGGTNLSFFIFEQLPVPAPRDLDATATWTPRCTVAQWLTPRVAELTCTAVDMLPLARDLGHGIFRWDDARRELIRAELDAAFFHLYGLPRDDVDYVMETFPIVKQKDVKSHGEYRTKRLILERYDALAEAMATGEPYQTVLDPPPAHPSLAHEEAAL